MPVRLDPKPPSMFRLNVSGQCASAVQVCIADDDSGVDAQDVSRTSLGTEVLLMRKGNGSSSK